MRGEVSAFPVASIAIIGSGPTAWLAAATLARVLHGSCAVQVIETGFDDATWGAVTSVPSLHRLLRLLGLDEVTLMRAGDATYRLGAEFRDWSAIGERYFAGFGGIGTLFDAVPFQHYWLRAHSAGACAPFEDFSLAAQAARSGRFALPQPDPRSILPPYTYAWHFDSARLTDCLRAHALSLGATAIAGRFAATERVEDGSVRALVLEDGGRVAAGLYVDVDGALASALGLEIEDWSAWLPCDRVYTQRCAPDANWPPFSTVSAAAAGWRFAIPLQNSCVRGLVTSSEFMDEDAAIASFAGDISAAAQRHPPHCARLVRGRPREFWIHNCILLPGNRLDPLEGTALHLAQSGITRLLAHFPVGASSPPDRDEYNRLTIEEYDRLRDLLVLHYHATRRDDSPYWQRCRTMTLPDTLARRLELFLDSGRLTIGEEEHCGVEGWLAVLLGQGFRPRSFDPLAEIAPFENLRSALISLAAEIRARAAALPGHRESIASRGAAVPAGSA